MLKAVEAVQTGKSQLQEKRSKVIMYLIGKERLAENTGFREHVVRRNPWYHGVKRPFDPNIMKMQKEKERGDYGNRKIIL